ncbi:MAG: hypothetical protein JRN02_07065 [Nitrososphaerota archaeon]|nr:hypothetical protein [Nitrososphaerota archaeon]
MSYEPYVLYYGSNFFNRAKKVYAIGMLDKPFGKILKKYGENSTFLNREQASQLLDSFSRQNSITVSNTQIMKNLLEALFLPTSLLYSYFKKLSFAEAQELDDLTVMEFMGSQTKPFKLSPLLIYMWFLIPKSEEGYTHSINLMKRIKDDVGVPPVDKEEWDDLKPLIEKFSRTLPVRGSAENLWEKL